MAVTIGEVRTFGDAKADKAQVMKIIEETAEVFSAWEDWNGCGFDGRIGYEGYVEEAMRERLVDECADVVQALSNLLAALGVDDMQPAMSACEARNMERGRL